MMLLIRISRKESNNNNENLMLHHMRCGYIMIMARESSTFDNIPLEEVWDIKMKTWLNNSTDSHSYRANEASSISTSLIVIIV